jgi:hypothetical protein
MNKFSCIRSLGEEIYYATLIAENEEQARDMALEETNKKWSRSGGRAREWSVRVLEPRPHHRLRLPRGMNSTSVFFS